MKLTLNGETRGFNEVSDLAELVRVLGLDVAKIAVERNLTIIPRSAFARTTLSDGDRIEIVHFVGGG